jgi:hypothetical protein
MPDQKPLLNSPKRTDMPNSEEILGGPEFEPAPGWGHRVSQWLKKYFSRVILPGIAIVILVLGINNYMANKSDRETFELDEVGTTGIVRLEEDTGEILTVEERVYTDDEGDAVSILEVADPGEGITHLARKALKKYLEFNEDLELQDEHKIYIEDYLKDMIGSEPLEIGDTIEFSTLDMSDAIDAALTLNDAQIENLSKYVPLVSF